MILKEWVVPKIQEEWLFKYKVEWAAVERLNSASFCDKYLLYPALHITFCLLEISSNAKHPAW